MEFIVVDVLERFSPSRVTIVSILRFVAYYYVILAAINDGITGIWLGIPFALYLFYDAFHFKNFYRYLNILILLLCCILFFIDKSKWKAIYPMVDTTLQITQEVAYIKQNRHIFLINENLTESNSTQRILPGTNIHVLNQVSQGTADLTATYRHQVEVDFNGDLSLYEFSGSALSRLFYSQNRSYVRNRIPPTLIGLTHLVLYPMVLLLLLTNVPKAFHLTNRK